MTQSRLPYSIPTLKITSRMAASQEMLHQALTDYSNDMQSFLQRLVSNLNKKLHPVDVQAGAGYTTLLDGTIIQWGTFQANNPGIESALPLVFPKNFWSVASSSGAAAAIVDPGHVLLTTPAAGLLNVSIIAIGD